MTAFLTTLTKYPLEQYCRFNFGTDYENFIKKYPLVDKVAFVINHAFRTSCMIALAEKLPYSKMTNCAILTAGSYFYRTTVEWRCSLKFALPSCFGAFSYMIAKSNNFSPISTIPLAGYTFTVLCFAYTLSPCQGSACSKKKVN
ncbi:MAG TPA: hypothetical protein PLC42_06330 [Parachlamydiaceae bacterium]|nr:hypothetical protein [Parachlamydiaceae bacterium]